jgi:NitT/TauT family transport system substrate-binding protein
VDTELADAEKLYTVLADIGGPELVGPAPVLDPHTFYTASGPSE